MCRWMAWFGQPVLLDELLFKSPHGIIDQSLHARMGAETTNGDGFGVGWYGHGDGPGLFRSTTPAWSDANLRDIAPHIESPLFLTHVRAAIGSPVEINNCHPFRRDRWLFVHNGYVAGLKEMRRDLMLAIAPELFPEVKGTTDTEILFHLALTFGLETDPIGALEQTVGLVEAVAREHGVAEPMQGTFGISDGSTFWAVRYSSAGKSRTLFFSAEPESIQSLYPDNPRFARMSPDDRLVVSEPFSDLPGVWEPIREATALVVRSGGFLEQQPFSPRAPDSRAADADLAPSK
jgi:glutamine amidotransferase